MNNFNRTRISQIVKESVRNYLNEKISAINNIEFLYHATPSCYINSIKKYGLGGKQPKIRFWDYTGTEYENIKQGVFLATDEYVAESYVENSEAFEELSDLYEEQYGKELEIAVFAIKMRDINPKLLSIDNNNRTDDESEATYFYNGVIPYSKLQKLKLY